MKDHEELKKVSCLASFFFLETAYFIESLAQEVQKAKRYKKPIHHTAGDKGKENNQKLKQQNQSQYTIIQATKAYKKNPRKPNQYTITQATKARKNRANTPKCRRQRQRRKHSAAPKQNSRAAAHSRTQKGAEPPQHA
jgi:serine phosphatase RsbU (regulator of sigma subunit)